jgi:hypothetical protein
MLFGYNWILVFKINKNVFKNVFKRKNKIDIEKTLLEKK